jgi:heme-degrading monooxygenase HmoA
VNHRDTEATEEEERRIRKILTFLLLCVFPVSSVPLWFKSPGSLSNPVAGVLRLRGAMVVMDIRSRLMAVCCLTLEGTMYASILWGDRKKATGDVETLWQRVAAQPGLVTAYVLANVADMQDGLVLSIWESEEAFDAYAASSLRADVEAVGALDRKNYHVLRATV